MIKGLKYTLIYVVLLLALLSCNPTDFELPAHQAELYLPIIDLDLNLQDLILADTTGTLKEDSTGLISLNYLFSDSKTFEELFPISDVGEDFTIPGIPSEIPDFHLDIPLSSGFLNIDTGFYADFPPWEKNYESEINIEKFIEAEFKSGTMDLEIRNDFPFIISAGLVVELLNSGEQEPFMEFVLPESIDPDNVYTFADATLTDKHLSGEFTFRISHLSTPGGNDLTVDQGDMLNMRISYENIVLNRAVFLTPEFELPSLNLNLPLIFPFGARLEELRMDGGTIRLEIPDLNSFFVLKLTLPTATNDGNPVSFNLGESLTEISMENLEIDLSSADPPYNRLPVEMQLMFSESIDTFEIKFDSPLEGRLEIVDIDFDFLNGYMGVIYDVLKDRLKLDFFQQVRSGSLAFNNPQITITLKNGIGTTNSMLDDGEGLYIKGSNERLYGDSTATIGSSMEGFTVAEAPSRGEYTIATLTMNEETEPELNEFFALLPTFLETRIPYKTGTDQINMNQFMDDESVLQTDIDIELPLDLAADRFILTDTTLYVVDTTNGKYIARSAEFHANIESYFPLELEIQNYFLDSNRVVIDSLFEERTILDPAVIDEDGKVLAPYVAELLVYMNNKDLENLRNTAYLVTNVRIQTVESEYVRLLSSYNLKYKLIGDIQTDIYWNQ